MFIYRILLILVLSLSPLSFSSNFLFGLIRHNSFGWIVNHFNDIIEHQDQISEEGDHNEDNTLKGNFDVMNLTISCDPRRRNGSGLLKSKNWMPSYEIKKLDAERGSRVLYRCERIESQIKRNGNREVSNQEKSWFPNGGVLCSTEIETLKAKLVVMVGKNDETDTEKTANKRAHDYNIHMEEKQQEIRKLESDLEAEQQKSEFDMFTMLRGISQHALDQAKQHALNQAKAK